MGHRVSERCTEHEWCIHLCHHDLSSLTEHQLGSGHTVFFSENTVLLRSASIWNRVINKLLEIKLGATGLNWKDSLQLSASWLPELRLIKLVSLDDWWQFPVFELCGKSTGGGMCGVLA